MVRKHQNTLIWTQKGQNHHDGIFLRYDVITIGVENAPIYWYMQNKPKLMTRSRENGKNYRKPLTPILDT